MSDVDTENARKLLTDAGLFFDSCDDDDEEYEQMLNMNDVWCWACAYGEPVPDHELIVLAGLFFSYGWSGILYWVSERNDGMRSEFHHYDRAIDFVKNEERISNKYTTLSDLAYAKETYTLGEV